MSKEECLNGLKEYLVDNNYMKKTPLKTLKYYEDCVSKVEGLLDVDKAAKLYGLMFWWVVDTKLKGDERIEFTEIDRDSENEKYSLFEELPFDFNVASYDKTLRMVIWEHTAENVENRFDEFIAFPSINNPLSEYAIEEVINFFKAIKD